MCVCGKQADYEQCCGPIIDGTVKAADPEQLMRARYTAYAKGEIDFVMGSHHPDTRDQVDRSGAAEWSAQAKWKSLEVKTNEPGEADNHFVEFVAHYEIGDQLVRHHELAEFRKHAGEWRFYDADMIRPEPHVRDSPKLGRNDPCHCGSGKKLKKCHG